MVWPWLHPEHQVARMRALSAIQWKGTCEFHIRASSAGRRSGPSVCNNAQRQTPQVGQGVPTVQQK